MTDGGSLRLQRTAVGHAGSGRGAAIGHLGGQLISPEEICQPHAVKYYEARNIRLRVMKKNRVRKYEEKKGR